MSPEDLGYEGCLCMGTSHSGPFRWEMKEDPRVTGEEREEAEADRGERSRFRADTFI